MVRRLFEEHTILSGALDYVLLTLFKHTANVFLENVEYDCCGDDCKNDKERVALFKCQNPCITRSEDISNNEELTDADANPRDIVWEKFRVRYAVHARHERRNPRKGSEKACNQHRFCAKAFEEIRSLLSSEKENWKTELREKISKIIKKWEKDGQGFTKGVLDDLKSDVLEILKNENTRNH